MNETKATARTRPKDAAGGLHLRHLVILLVLLVPDGLALRRLAAVIDYRWLLGYAVTVSLATYALYGADKDSAADSASRWRASERLLHGFE
ncbi:MAG TPA: hypothetical protein VMD31_00510, partial [Opitutaceae bacterium]|nr:hypothetical protein [Opitutaceae bacterium]